MKVIWITGASSGIGEALAYEYNRQGHFVILSARRESELRRVKNQCQTPHKAQIYPLDLEKCEQLSETCNHVQKLFGQIDTVILSGGLSQRSLALETDFSVTERLMRINFLSSVIIAKSIVPSMIKNQKGQIVVISSLVGKFGTPYRSSYAATKHALHGYFDSLRAEIHPHPVTISLICPGFVKTAVSLNALTKDGQPQQKMDEAQNQGMEVNRFAQIAFKKIEAQVSEVYIGGNEIFGVYLKRFIPKIFEKIITKAKVR